MVDFRPRPYKWLLAPLAAAVGASRLAVLLMSRFALPLSFPTVALELLVFSAFYFALSALVGALGREELRWLKNIFRKDRKASFKKDCTML